MSIQILTPFLAAQIAAGEVVENAASAIKELVENSIDADSSTIKIQIANGGLNQITILDNGSGIAQDDIHSLFKRHATSKIQTEKDLENIISLGFRGEALHSLSSVSEVEIHTRAKNETTGTRLQGQKGSLVYWEPWMGNEGTIVSVTNLFSNLPARLKFMGSTRSMIGKIQSVVTPYAINYPEKDFSLESDGKTLLSSYGMNNHREVITALYGAKTAESLISIREYNELIDIEALVSPPSISRSNRKYINISINGRPVLNRNITHSITNAYRGFLPIGRYPVVSLSIKLPPKEIDANVHPAKTEVRIHKQNELLGIISNVIRAELIKTSSITDFVSGSIQKDISWPAENIALSSGKINDYEHISNSKSNEWKSHKFQIFSGIENFSNENKILGQIWQSYILYNNEKELTLVDQHAAHERINYEKILQEQKDKINIQQGLLEPVIDSANEHIINLIRKNLENLSNYGWEVEIFGNSSYIIRSVPTIISGKNIDLVFREIIDVISENQKIPIIHEKLAATIACHSSIRAGQSMNHNEMNNLINDLAKCNAPETCPHGRPTTLRIQSGDISKQFGRT